MGGEFDCVDDDLVVGVIADESEELGEGEVDFFEEGAVAAAAVHEFGGHFAAEFDTGFGDDAGEPGDAVGGSGFCREIGHVCGVGGGLAFLVLEEVVTADGGDFEGGFEAGFAVGEVVIDEVEEFLGGAADGFEEGESLWGGEHGGGGLVAVFPGGDGVVPGLSEGGLPVVFVHGLGRMLVWVGYDQSRKESSLERRMAWASCSQGWREEGGVFSVWGLGCGEAGV